MAFQGSSASAAGPGGSNTASLPSSRPYGAMCRDFRSWWPAKWHRILWVRGMEENSVVDIQSTVRSGMVSSMNPEVSKPLRSRNPIEGFARYFFCALAFAAFLFFIA